MKILKEYELNPFFMEPGSTIEVSWNDEKILTYPVEREMIVNSCIIVEVSRELGFKNGIGAILGERV